MNYIRKLIVENLSLKLLQLITSTEYSLHAFIKNS